MTEAALASLRRWGGVLEHPRDSKAWSVVGLNRPPHDGCWVNADFYGLWICSVDQGHYRHEARKPTWLLVAGSLPPALRWGPSSGKRSLENLNRRKRLATPVAFRDLLLDLAVRG